MIVFVIWRMVGAIPTLFAVLMLVFVIVRIIPGDLAAAILGEQATPPAVAALDAKLGFDKPMWCQFINFMLQSLSGDFGHSMVTGRPILTDVVAVLPHTIDPTLASLAVGVVLGLPRGFTPRCGETVSATT